MKREQVKAKFDLVASTIRRIYGKGAKSGQPRLASSKLRAASDAGKGTEYSVPHCCNWTAQTAGNLLQPFTHT